MPKKFKDTIRYIDYINAHIRDDSMLYADNEITRAQEYWYWLGLVLLAPGVHRYTTIQNEMVDEATKFQELDKWINMPSSAYDETRWTCLYTDIYRELYSISFDQKSVFEVTLDNDSDIPVATGIGYSALEQEHYLKNGYSLGIKTAQHGIKCTFGRRGERRYFLAPEYMAYILVMENKVEMLNYLINTYLEKNGYCPDIMEAWYTNDAGFSDISVSYAEDPYELVWAGIPIISIPELLSKYFTLTGPPVTASEIDMLMSTGAPYKDVLMIVKNQCDVVPVSLDMEI